VTADAYATSHLSAEACIQRLTAGRGDGYRLAAATAAATAQAWHWQWSSLLNVKDDHKLRIRPVHMQRMVKCFELRREGGMGQRARSAISP